MDLGVPSVTAWAALSCVSWTFLAFFLCQACFPCSCGQLAQIMDKRLPVLVGEKEREMVRSQFWWLRLLRYPLLEQQFNVVVSLYKAFCCQRDVPATPLALGPHCSVVSAQMFLIWVRSDLWICLMCDQNWPCVVDVSEVPNAVPGLALPRPTRSRGEGFWSVSQPCPRTACKVVCVLLVQLLLRTEGCCCLKGLWEHSLTSAASNRLSWLRFHDNAKIPSPRSHHYKNLVSSWSAWLPDLKWQWGEMHNSSCAGIVIERRTVSSSESTV